MRIRLSAIVAALAIAACAVMYFERADGQQAPIPAAGRFQFVVSEHGHGQIFVFEPATGQCWSRHSAHHVNDEWHDLGSPVIKKE